MDKVATRQFMELERRHWWFEGRRQIFFHLLARYLPAGQPLDILDVGCGVGGMMTELRAYGEPAGIELDEEMVRLCHERGFHRALVGSGTDIPHPAAAFDLVTFFDCIEHIPDDDRALREAARVLRPDGWLFISVPAYQFLYANNDRLAHHQRRYTLGRLAQQVRAAGFAVTHASYINVWLFPLILPAVLLIKAKERLIGDNGATTNLSYAYPRWLNGALAAIFSSEKHLVSRWRLPAGHSICLLARRGAVAGGTPCLAGELCTLP